MWVFFFFFVLPDYLDISFLYFWQKKKKKKKFHFVFKKKRKKKYFFHLIVNKKQKHNKAEMNNKQYEDILICVKNRIKEEETKQEDAKNETKKNKYELFCARPEWFKKWTSPDPFFTCLDESAVLYFQKLLLQTCEWSDGSAVNLLRYMIKFSKPSDDDPEELSEHFVLRCGLGDAQDLNLPRDCALWIETNK